MFNMFVVMVSLASFSHIIILLSIVSE